MIELADKQERVRRAGICRTCPFVRLIGRKQFMQCTKCHCPLATKTRFLRAQCPAGKW